MDLVSNSQGVRGSSRSCKVNLDASTSSPLFSSNSTSIEASRSSVEASTVVFYDPIPRAFNFVTALGVWGLSGRSLIKISFNVES